MFKKVLLIFLLSATLVANAGEKFKAGVSIDNGEGFFAPIESSFVDLNYSINYFPLNLLREEELLEKETTNASKKITGFVMPPVDYKISLSVKKTNANEESASHLEHLLKNNPNDIDLLFAYAIQLKKENDLINALNTANKIIRINSDFALAHFLRGDILRRMERFKEAVDEYIFTTQINPYCADAYYNIAKILELIDNKELALDYYKMAYQINPNDVETREIILDSYIDL